MPRQKVDTGKTAAALHDDAAATLQALQESEARYRSLIESLPDAIYVVADHQVVMVNLACVALFAARTADDLIGRNPLSLVPATYQPLLRQHIKRALIDGFANPSKEYQILCCDDTLQSVDGVSVPFDYHGRRALQVILRDATPRKRMEALLHQRGEEMERSLAWEVAQQTVGGIAHEMNQPLNAITTLGEAALRLLQRSGDVPPRLQESVIGMVAGAQRAGRVLQELMHFLKQPDMHRQMIDLDPLIHHAVEQTQATQRFSGTLVHHSEHSTPLPGAYGNQAQIEKVLLNLLRNAVEACTGKPDAIIQISAEQYPNCLQVSICDNGPGVAADFSARLFQPFSSTKPGGIGMGLAICYSLIKEQGGRLWHEAASGGGACFSFSLPRADDKLQNKDHS